VTRFLLADLMEHVHLFKPIGQHIWPKILPLLKPAVFRQDEYVCFQDDPSDEMFMVTGGQLRGTTSYSEEVLQQTRAYQDQRRRHHHHHHDDDHHRRHLLLQSQRSTSERRKSGALRSVLMRGHGRHHGGDEEPPADHTLAAEGQTDRGDAAPHSGFRWSSANMGHTESERDQRFQDSARDSPLDDPADHPGDGHEATDQKVIVRDIVPGNTINSLCVLKVWDKCVETVQAVEESQLYSISASAFQALFHDTPQALELMREFTIRTSFFMTRNQPNAPTKYGVPLFMYSRHEIERREKLLEDRVHDHEHQEQMERMKSMRHIISSDSSDSEAEAATTTATKRSRPSIMKPPSLLELVPSALTRRMGLGVASPTADGAS
jgi:hypothetical protein